jgi:hypothetical protein
MAMWQQPQNVVICFTYAVVAQNRAAYTILVDKEAVAEMIYTHYGASEYNPEKFKPIKNRPISAKPEGGLWASPLGAKHGWKEWCEGNEFHVEKLEKSFQFTLAENANILTLRSTDQLRGLPEAKQEFDMGINAWVCLDFEKLAADGVDAILVDISGDETAEWMEGLYWKLYGWDCDSILILNKEIIRP